ncbi:sulfotransferase 1B1-like [Styela clava]
MEQFVASLPDEKKPIAQQLVATMKEMMGQSFDFKSMKCSEWKGYRFIPFFQAETARRAFENYEFEENTILLASYPKTGTNWTAEVIRQILYGDNERFSALSKALPPPLTALEIWRPEKLDLLEHIPLPRRVLLTHLPEELVNYEKLKKKNGKVVVLVRNPKDQAVSWFHFTKNRHFDGLRDEISSDWNQFLSDYVQGKHPMITKPGQWYPDFLLGWNKHKDEDNILFLVFEDMKRDPQKEIRRLANFLEVELNNERVSSIAQSTSFDSMKKAADAGAVDSAQVHKSLNMMRKGQVGSWKDSFTVAQSELMDSIIEKKLGDTDINFTYVL